MKAKILSLKAVGFGVFGDVEFEFRAGRFAILGRNKDSTSGRSNGSGKSTIFKALSWGLFGETIDKLSEPAVVHKEHERAFVEVTFSVGAGLFSVRRSRTAKTGKLELLQIDENPIVDLTLTSKAATQEAIDRILGVGWETFRCTVLFGQGDQARFASPYMADAARKGVLASILRLDAYEVARSKSREIREQCSKQIEASEREISKTKETIKEIETEIWKLKVKKAGKLELSEGAEEARGRFEKAKAKAEKEKAKAEKALEKALKLEEEYVAELEDLTTIERAGREAIANLRARLVAAKSSERAAGDAGVCSECGQPRPFDPGLLEALTRKRKALETRIAETETKLKEGLEDLPEVRGGVKECLAKVSELRSEIKVSSAKIDDATDELERIDETVRSVDDDIAEIDAEIERLGTDADFAASGLVVPEARITELTKRKTVADWWVSGLGPKGVPAYAMEQALPALNMRANRHLLSLSDGEIEVCWTATTIGSSGAVKEQLTQNVVIHGLEGVAVSGGQSKKIELATELALAELVQEIEGTHPSLLLLDEALDGLDAEGRERVIEWVRELEPETIFVISHDPEIVEALDAWLVVTKDGGESTVEWVE